MTWLQSIFIAGLTGALGLLCGGLIMNACVDWYRVSSFEGKSGYAVIGMALLGGIAGAIVGLVAARFVAAGAEPGFLKGLGYGSGAVVAIAVVALGVSRLAADLAPEMDGCPLELAIEVRCPKGFVIPAVLDQYGATAEVYLPGSRRLPSAKLQLEAAQLLDGQWVVPSTVPLTTRSSRKFISVRFNEENNLIFGLFLRSNPKPSDLEWSKWVDSGWDAGKPEPAPEAKFKARYRVLRIEREAPAPDPAALEAEKFAALKPDAPLEEWLAFMTNEAPMARQNAVADVVAKRQSELAKLIRSPDETVRERALNISAYLMTPAPEVTEAILAEGRDIAAGIRRFNEMKDDDPKFHDVLLVLRGRFNDWKQAWWVVQQHLGVDGRPPVQEIYDLALVRARGTAMSDIEVNARVILYELNKSATEKKP
ncbi:MAG: hypothetical protein ABIQ12_01775 [Opitutaceae bacterium]